VRLRDGELEFVPQFGPLRRQHSSALTLGGASVAVIAALALTGVGALAFGTAFVGAMLAARDVGRYITTEGCLTRLQMLWTAHMSAAARAPARAGTLGTGADRFPLPSARQH